VFCQDIPHPSMRQSNKLLSFLPPLHSSLPSVVSGQL
jgi:hypothetical protein